MAYDFTPTGDLAVDLAHIYNDANGAARPMSNEELAAAEAEAITYDISSGPYASGTFSDLTASAATLLQLVAGASRGITVSTSTDRVTITKAGVYLVNANIYIVGSIVNIGGISIFKNGVQQTYSWAAFNNGHANNGSSSTSITMLLEVGDYITFHAVIYPGGANLTWNGGAVARWNVILVG